MHAIGIIVISLDDCSSMVCQNRYITLAVIAVKEPHVFSDMIEAVAVSVSHAIARLDSAIVVGVQVEHQRVPLPIDILLYRSHALLSRSHAALFDLALTVIEISHAVIEVYISAPA